MGLPYPGQVPEPFSVIGPIMDAFMNCSIRIVDPQSAITSDYNSLSDSGGVAAPSVVWAGNAMVQRVRRPALGSTSTEWVAASPYSFQLPMTTPQFLVRKGMRIQVLDGGDDQALKEMSFIVTVGLSSSHAPVRLIEATAETVTVYPQSDYIVPLNQFAPDPENDGYLIP